MTPWLRSFNSEKTQHLVERQWNTLKNPNGIGILFPGFILLSYVIILEMHLLETVSTTTSAFWHTILNVTILKMLMVNWGEKTYLSPRSNPLIFAFTSIIHKTHFTTHLEKRNTFRIVGFWL